MIRLRVEELQRAAVRSIEIVKSRGHAFRIVGGQGIEVYRRVQAPRVATAPRRSIPRRACRERRVLPRQHHGGRRDVRRPFVCSSRAGLHRVLPLYDAADRQRAPRRGPPEDRRRGEPDEYFNDATAREYMMAWEVTAPDYVEAILAHSATSNGVVGGKLMAAQLPTLGRWLGIRNRRDAFAGLDALAARLPALRWITLTRRDRVRQAISYWKALQANAFASTEAQDASIDERLLAEIDHGNVAWRTYFRERAITPLALAYEDDLHDSFEPAVRKVLAAVGVTPSAPHGIEVARRPQADALTEMLVERYRARR